MRVAHIIKVTRMSGAERHLLVLLKGLRDKDVDGHLIILVEPDNPMDDMMDEAQRRGIPIHRVAIHRDYDATIILRLRKLLRTLQPDIVHTHLIHADLYGLLSAKIGGVKTIIASRHNDDRFRYRHVIRHVSRILWWLSDGGIAISTAIRDFTTSIEGASFDKIDVVRYGLEYQWITDEEIQSARKKIRDELHLANDTILLGIVCRLVEQKGIPYALEAFKAIYKYFPTAHLVIAGDGELAQELKSAAQQLGISGRVHWLGWRDDAPMVLASLDIFLMPSLWEGFGLVLLEAMSKRVPIVASRVSAIPEVIQDGQSGLLVKPRDTSALSQALYLLLVDRPFRKHLGLLGEDCLQQQFSVEQMVVKTIEVYRKRMR